MAGLTPITGANGLTRIVALPSPELEKLPPASPLRTSDESPAPANSGEGAAIEAHQVMRWTRCDPPGAVESDQAMREAASAESQATGPEAAPQEPSASQELGAHLDALV